MKQFNQRSRGKARLALTAGLVLAMAFTFSCSGDDGGGGGDSSSSGDGGGQGEVSSSSEGGGSSPSEGGGSSPSEGGGSSPSEGGGSSPSEGGGSSPSEGGGSSPSEGGGSSPSEGGNSSSSSVVGGGNPCPTASGNFIDPRDGKAYKFEIAPNGTVWMSENLNYSRGNTLGWCYGTETELGPEGVDLPTCDNGYGRVYEWAKAIDGNPPQGLCPDGWHIPSTAEWSSVIDDGSNPYRKMSLSFYIYPGNYNTNSQYPPLGWKDRDESGFYWTSSGNTYFTGFWEGPVSSYYQDDVFRLEAQDGASSEDRFSVRCMANYKCSATERSSSSVVPPSSSSAHDILYGTPVTYDGETYPTVVIGTQTWFAKNLNYDVEGSVCYDNGPANCDKYGRLYNLETALTVCPSGWHLPSYYEWTILTDYAGGSSVAGRKLKATSGWNENGNGTDDYGFSALPGGNGYSDGSFDDAGYFGRWWSASEGNRDGAYFRDMDYRNEYAGGYYDEFGLFSVRCLQD